MDRWLYPPSFGCRRCSVQAICGRCSSSSSLSYLTGLVSSSFTAKSLALVHGLEWCHCHLNYIPLSIGPFLNRFPVNSYPLLHGSSISPTKVLLGFLGSFRFLLLPCSSKLPMGPGYAGLPVNELETRSPKPEQHSPLPMFPAHWPRPLQRLGTLATLFGDEIFLTTPSPSRFFRYPRS